MDHPPLAKHLLVLMVRGIFFKLDFPYAHFGTETATADILHPIIWEAVRQIESIGLALLLMGPAQIEDFSGCIKLAFDHLLLTKQRILMRRMGKGGYTSYPIPDPPHLIKTTRNCLSHSGNGSTRLMKVIMMILLFHYNIK